jgi:tetratricopeptide (TPR) repeat protein
MSTEDSRKRAPRDTVESEDNPKRIRLSESGDWILHEPAYQSWAASNSKPNLVWIQGPPGSGKSYLTRKIERDRLENDTASTTISFFCDAHSTPAIIARSLLDQLDAADSSTEVGEPAPEAESLGLATGDGGYRLWDELEKKLIGYESVNLIIDGLDEVDRQFTSGLDHNLPQIIQDLAYSAIAKLRVLISSRPEPQLLAAFALLPVIVVTAEKVEEDLQRFIEFEIKEHPKLEARLDYLGPQILWRADGLFMTARLLVAAIAADDDEQAIEKLDALPLGMSELYARIFEGMSAVLGSKELLVRDHVLRWLYTAVRPLRLAELMNAFTVDSNAFVPDFESKAIFACGSLVKVEGGVLKLAHYSLKDYLESEHISVVHGNRLESKRAHGHVAKTCINYLLHPAFGRFLEANSDSDTWSTNYPLLEYASLYWVHHVALADPLDDELITLVKTLLLTSPNAFTWSDTFHPTFMDQSVLAIPPRSAQNARFFHLFMLKNQLVRFLKQSGNDMDEYLFAAIVTRHEDALKAARERQSNTSDLLKCLINLSFIHGWMPGQRPKATQLIKEAYDVFIEADLPLTSMTIELMQALGDDHKINGRYDAAKAVFKELLGLASEQSVLSRPQFIFTYDALGWVEMRLGQLDEAEQDLRTALDMVISTYGTRSPFTLRSKVTLAEVLSKVGRMDEAEALCAQLVEQLRQHRANGTALPKDSVSQLVTLALVYKSRADYKSAKDAFAVVVEDRRKVFGNEHPMTLAATFQMAMVQSAAGEVNEAGVVFSALLPLQIRALGTEHPDVKDTNRYLKALEATKS